MDCLLATAKVMPNTVDVQMQRESKDGDSLNGAKIPKSWLVLPPWSSISRVSAKNGMRRPTADAINEFLIGDCLLGVICMF